MADNRRVDFDAIKARADFRAVPAHHGLTPVGKGDQAKIRRPFHDDGEPSRSVNLAKGLFPCFPCHVAGNALDFVHRMETRDGSTATLRQAGLVLAGIGKGEGRPDGDGGKARQGGQEGRGAADQGEAAPTRAPAPAAALAAPAGRGAGVPGEGREARRNKPLGFALPLDPRHPYLTERGIPPELVETFGLGYCEKGSMAGRVCIPIHNWQGQTVAYAGRWVGKLEDLPEGEGKHELPGGFHKGLELFNLNRVKGSAALAGSRRSLARCLPIRRRG
jgi:DNA primase